MNNLKTLEEFNPFKRKDWRTMWNKKSIEDYQRARIDAESDFGKPREEDLNDLALRDIRDHFDKTQKNWKEFRERIDREAKEAGYDSIQDYMEFMVKSRKMTNKQRVYYMVG